MDRAFVPNRASHAQELATVADVAPQAPHQVANALAAAALARAHGVPPGRSARACGSSTRRRIGSLRSRRWRGGLRGRFKGHQLACPLTSLRAYDSVVWIAGGQGKGQDFDEFVSQTADRMRAAVLLGLDREVISCSLARHAPGPGGGGHFDGH